MSTERLRGLLPATFVDLYRRLNRWRDARVNRGRTAEEVFTDIYERNKWGGAPGEFNSGAGTTDESAVAAYVGVVEALAASEGFLGRPFVDLGCGDFRVGQRLRPLSGHYVGVDIVEPLVRHHAGTYSDARTSFVRLNIAEDPLPHGDVCFVRQVLQHLSNAQASAVLDKLAAFRWVFITEHYPTDNSKIQPNLDKVHGGDIRLYRNSGIYLTAPPFSLPAAAVRQVLEVPGVGGDERKDAGVIRTFLYTPGGAA